jgi:hypothetical protein
VFDTDISASGNYVYYRAGDPTPVGLGQNKYVITMWKKTMRITAKLLESDAEITRSIMSGLRNHLNASIAKAVPKIASDIKVAVKEALIQEPEYTSLTSGTLKIEFGIPDASQVGEVG